MKNGALETAVDIGATQVAVGKIQRQGAAARTSSRRDCRSSECVDGGIVSYGNGLRLERTGLLLRFAGFCGERIELLGAFVKARGQIVALPEGLFQLGGENIRVGPHLRKSRRFGCQFPARIGDLGFEIRNGCLGRRHIGQGGIQAGNFLFPGSELLLLGSEGGLQGGKFRSEGLLPDRGTGFALPLQDADATEGGSQHHQANLESTGHGSEVPGSLAVADWKCISQRVEMSGGRGGGQVCCFDLEGDLLEAGAADGIEKGNHGAMARLPVSANVDGGVRS